MNLSLLLDEIKNSIAGHRFIFVLAVTSCIAGMICGFATDREAILYINYESNCELYIGAVLGKCSVFSILFRRVLLYLPAVGFSFLSGQIVFCFPLHLFIIFYKGFILGATCVIIFTQYSLAGVLIGVVAVVPFGLIACLIFAIFSGMLYENGCENYRCRQIRPTRMYLRLWGVIAIVILIACILEVLLIVIVVRPLNFLL